MGFCSMDEPEHNKILMDIARDTRRSLQDIFRRINGYDSIRNRAEENRRRRLSERERMLTEFEDELRKYEEALSYKIMDSILQGEDIDKLAEMMMRDEIRKALEKKVMSLKSESKELDAKDIEASLEELKKSGYIEIKNGEIKITSKGAQALAKRALEKALKKISKKEIGSRDMDEIGHGPEKSTRSRPYELGDEYESVDIEKTLLNSFERTGEISLKTVDFQVYESIHQNKICWGLIIDESWSMRWHNKFNAAIDTALALSEIIRRNPKDSLEIFVFSEEVRRIQPWDILNVRVPMRYTNIRAGMKAFRRAVTDVHGDKQVYLITDTEPNTENGTYVGFRKAVVGVLEEASHYRQHGITLNIIMLDQNPYLRKFSSMLARKNLGRVLFTTPSKLEEVVIEDYLVFKRKKHNLKEY